MRRPARRPFYRRAYQRAREIGPARTLGGATISCGFLFKMWQNISLLILNLNAFLKENPDVAGRLAEEVYLSKGLKLAVPARRSDGVAGLGEREAEVRAVSPSSNAGRGRLRSGKFNWGSSISERGFSMLRPGALHQGEYPM